MQETHKGLLSKIHIELLKLSNKKATNVVRPETLMYSSPKKIHRWQDAYENVFHMIYHQANENLNNNEISLQPTRMLCRMAKSRILISPNAGVNVEQQELIIIATVEDSLAVS